MYFDAVLDITYKPVFNGTRPDTIAFVQTIVEYPRYQHYQVCIGETLEVVSLQDYLTRT